MTDVYIVHNKKLNSIQWILCALIGYHLRQHEEKTFSSWKVFYSREREQQAKHFFLRFVSLRIVRITARYIRISLVFSLTYSSNMWVFKTTFDDGFTMNSKFHHLKDVWNIVVLRLLRETKEIIKRILEESS